MAHEDLDAILKIYLIILFYWLVYSDVIYDNALGVRRNLTDDQSKFGNSIKVTMKTDHDVNSERNPIPQNHWQVMRMAFVGIWEKNGVWAGNNWNPHCALHINWTNTRLCLLYHLPHGTLNRLAKSYEWKMVLNKSSLHALSGIIDIQFTRNKKQILTVFERLPEKPTASGRRCTKFQ